MGRWDPEPSPFQRWIARHRRRFLVGAVVVIAIAIGGVVYDLATSGFKVGLVLMALVAVSISINPLSISMQSSRFVEKYDKARGEDPRSK